MSHLCRNRKVPDVMKERMRRLRKEQTPAEAALWEVVRDRKLGVKFRRQHAVGHLILDLYCAELQLGIEVDGSIHQLPEVQEHDQYREIYLKDSGITVLHFSNEDVLHRTESVASYLITVITRLSVTER
jgi:leucyl-tRNA synthetase